MFQLISWFHLSKEQNMILQKGFVSVEKWWYAKGKD